MKKIKTITIVGILCSLSLFAQDEIVANPGEYVEAVNYGGNPELKRFLQQEMNYPENAYKNKIEGTVELLFIVDSKTGETSKLQVKESINTELDNEAIRLYKMLLFKPSYYKGSRVTTYSTLKIKFSIRSYNRYCKKRGYQNIDLNNPKIDYSMRIYQDNAIDIKPKVVFEDSLMILPNFIYKNLKYPEGTLKLNITGTVKLSFIVEPTGRITNIKVVKGVGGGATAEAERILKLLKWKPGRKGEKKVRVKNTFEVSFNLSNNSEFKYVPGQM
jgi:TonB family protein